MQTKLVQPVCVCVCVCVGGGGGGGVCFSLGLMDGLPEITNVLLTVFFGTSFHAVCGDGLFPSFIYIYIYIVHSTRVLYTKVIITSNKCYM